MPSEIKQGFRFGISFYLIAMLFLLFDIEVLFLYPIAVELRAFGTFALVETVVFIGLLLLAFVYVWRRGALDMEVNRGSSAPSRRASASASCKRPRPAARRPRGRGPRASTSRSAS